MSNSCSEVLVALHDVVASIFKRLTTRLFLRLRSGWCGGWNLLVQKNLEINGEEMEHDTDAIEDSASVIGTRTSFVFYLLIPIKPHTTWALTNYYY